MAFTLIWLISWSRCSQRKIWRRKFFQKILFSLHSFIYFQAKRQGINKVLWKFKPKVPNGSHIFFSVFCRGSVELLIKRAINEFWKCSVNHPFWVKLRSGKRSIYEHSPHFNKPLAFGRGGLLYKVCYLNYFSRRGFLYFMDPAWEKNCQSYQPIRKTWALVLSQAHLFMALDLFPYKKTIYRKT